MTKAELVAAVVVAVLGSNWLGSIVEQLGKKFFGRRSVNDDMTMGLAHAEIYKLCQKYLRRGGVTIEELNDLVKYLYTPYRKLGGNGTGETLVNKVKALPILTKEQANELDQKVWSWQIAQAEIEEHEARCRACRTDESAAKK